jgi:hypothetical protein
LFDFLLPNEFVWKGRLKLPYGWPPVDVELTRGTDVGRPCDYAYLNLVTADGQQCVNGFWQRNNDGVPLPDFRDGWKFGTVAAAGPKALVTRQEYWMGLGVSDSATCSISFGSTRDANPLP